MKTRRENRNRFFWSGYVAKKQRAQDSQHISLPAQILIWLNGNFFRPARSLAAATASAELNSEMEKKKWLEIHVNYKVFVYWLLCVGNAKMLLKLRCTSWDENRTTLTELHSIVRWVVLRLARLNNCSIDAQPSGDWNWRRKHKTSRLNELCAGCSRWFLLICLLSRFPLRSRSSRNSLAFFAIRFNFGSVSKHAEEFLKLENV